MLKTASLTPLEKAVIINKSTEIPFSGRYTNCNIDGSYLCRNCGEALFRADSKFDSTCGWPSFDKEIANKIEYQIDSDNIREEILCVNCKAHLGHVFRGEEFTKLNTRHCVNSVSLDFVVDEKVLHTSEIILAAGCFWGVEYYLQRLSGVLKTEVGYVGGILDNPSYEQICYKNTGHLEVVRVIFDETKLTLEALLKYFFEIHDFSQANGQGPDIGNQYLSAIFCYNTQQKLVAQIIIDELKLMNYSVATQVRDMAVFWIAEDLHRNYYLKKQALPYCHQYIKKFN